MNKMFEQKCKPVSIKIKAKDPEKGFDFVEMTGDRVGIVGVLTSALFKAICNDTNSNEASAITMTGAAIETIKVGVAMRIMEDEWKNDEKERI